MKPKEGNKLSYLIFLLTCSCLVFCVSCRQYKINETSVHKNTLVKHGVWVEPSDSDSIQFYVFRYSFGIKNRKEYTFLKDGTKIIGRYKNDKKNKVLEFYKNENLYRKEYYTNAFLYRIELFDKGKRIKTIFCDPSW